MPWNDRDALRFNRKADTPEKQRHWALVANRVLKATGDEGRAVREANSFLKHSGVRPVPAGFRK